MIKLLESSIAMDIFRDMKETTSSLKRILFEPAHT
jgi:hypothetical protein